MRQSYPVILRALVAVFVIQCAACSTQPEAQVVKKPQAPLPAEIQRYEREAPIFKSKEIATGANLLDAPKGGQSLKPWLQDSPLVNVLKAGGCVLPVPPRLWIRAWRTDGSSYMIGFSFDGGLVYLPDGLYETDDQTAKVLGRLLDKLEQELVAEVSNAKKPCTYRVGTVRDGGTLWGIARLFYGEGSKWKVIFEANRDIITDPDAINGGMELNIPANP